jgi:hypothetical protein
VNSTPLVPLQTVLAEVMEAIDDAHGAQLVSVGAYPDETPVVQVDSIASACRVALQLGGGTSHSIGSQRDAIVIGWECRIGVATVLIVGSDDTEDVITTDGLWAGLLGDLDRLLDTDPLLARIEDTVPALTP